MNVLTRRGLLRSAAGLGLAAAVGYTIGRHPRVRATGSNQPTWTAVVPPTIGNWTQLHFNNATTFAGASNVPGSLFLRQAASPGYGLSAVIRPIVAASPWDFDVKIGFQPTGVPVDIQKMVLLVYDQASSKLEAIQFIHDSSTFTTDAGWGVSVVRYPDPGSLPTRVASGDLTVGNPLV